MDGNVQVVSSRWFEDCPARGMVLDESLYRPTMSLEEQGKGARNRGAKAQVKLGKRPQDDNLLQEAQRKLQRTVSSKLSRLSPRNERLNDPETAPAAALEQGPEDTQEDTQEEGAVGTQTPLCAEIVNRRRIHILEKELQIIGQEYTVIVERKFAVERKLFRCIRRGGTNDRD
jgi:hypothetical protein